MFSSLVCLFVCLRLLLLSGGMNDLVCKPVPRCVAFLAAGVLHTPFVGGLLPSVCLPRSGDVVGRSR